MSATVRRLRIAACCALLTGLAFRQQPGLVVADTKVDLAVSPAAWLARALHAWDPAGNFGQMQNQAYGYLFPMGPFFAAGQLLGVPAWVVQRLWWALLLCLACTGVVVLAGRLALGTPGARLAGGLAYALTPRILTELGAVSVEAWPMAIAPWVLVPLVAPARRRPLLLSALAVAAAGGVNATAVLAVLVLPALWLLCHHPPRRLLAWGAAVAGATAWWVVPLLVLGRYSPPFLDYIETADTTTRPTDAVGTLRGASHWLAYLAGAYGPGWPAGWALATAVPLVLATTVVAALGLAGLARPGMPHRRFLTTGVLAGVAIVGLGHLGDLPGLVAGPAHAWLDASGAPLRNLHKFDPVLRLPLVLGLIHLLGPAFRPLPARPLPARPLPPAGNLLPVRRAVLVAVAGLAAVAVTATPALAGGLPGGGSFAAVPGYWRAAAAWLDQHLGGGRVLVVPGARFPDYLWGAPGDEMVQPLLDAGWAVRNSIPLVPPATVRLLDAVESALAAGRAAPGLAAVLARSGVRYLLLRADLDTGRSGSTRPAAVRATLAATPGIVPVAAFGPYVGGQGADGAYLDRGLDVAMPALQVFQVAGAADPVGAYATADVRTVVGGPESLLDLAGAGLLGAAPTVLAGDLPAGLTTGGTVLTDGLRRREVTFGRARDNASATLTAAEPWRLDQPAHDYLPAWAAADQSAARQTVARYPGLRAVRASSSYAQALPLTGNRPEFQPYAALDGDRSTSWRSAPGTTAAGQWLEVEFDRPRRVPEVTVEVDRGADAIPTRITVRAGNEERTVPVTGTSVTVPLEGWLAVGAVRVTVGAVWGVRLGYGGVGLTEVTVPGLHPERTLAVPAPGAATGTSAPGAVLSQSPSAPSCLFLAGRPLCSPDAGRSGEDGVVLDRTVPALGGEYAVRLTARPRVGQDLATAIDDALGDLVRPRVTASTTGVAEPAARPGAVADGDPGTVWYAADEDRAPWLRLSWLTPRVLTGIRVSTGTAAASRPWSVTVLTDSGTRTGTLDEDGVLMFGDEVRTDDLTVLFTDSTGAVSFVPYANRFERLPIGVAELTVLPDGAVSPADRTAGVRMPCGSGPTIEIGGRKLPTAVTATVGDLLERRELPVRICGSGTVTLAAEAPTRVMVTASRLAEPARLTLLPSGSPTPAAAPVDSVLSITRWTATERRLTLGHRSAERVLVLRENAGEGWRATLAGRTLRPMVIDGWQQGWIIPPGLGGTVVLRYTPDLPYRVGLVAGAVLAVVLLLVALLVPVRRPVRAVPVPRTGLTAATGGVALLLIGGAGVVLLLLGALLAGYARIPASRRRTVVALAPWAPAVLLGLGALLSRAVAEPHVAAAPQLAAVAALTVLWLLSLPRARLRALRRWRWRRP
ncbi:alpha-(1-_3)-arabinofuranosyltransferase family protein [Actinoplanes sp. NPDC051851]|uniref:alpha-(1->3)-arabinofuranosyltransferase domain-containing protein n=1 Tax=Actinoplanes sp. NPDC051851 TaxID=3154753 RepID=UPI00343200A6